MAKITAMLTKLIASTFEKKKKLTSILFSMQRIK